jgi:hypothetical protein
VEGNFNHVASYSTYFSTNSSIPATGLLIVDVEILLMMILYWDGGFDLGIPVKALKRAESVFRETPKIKQILYYLRLVSGHGQSSSSFYTNIPVFFSL